MQYMIESGVQNRQTTQLTIPNKRLQTFRRSGLLKEYPCGTVLSSEDESVDENGKLVNGRYWKLFRKKMRRFMEIEYGQVKLNFNTISSLMWSRHKMRFGNK